MTLQGSDLPDWIKQFFQQENSDIHMANKAFLATTEEKKNCLVLLLHILYFTREGKWNVRVCVCVCICEEDRDTAKVL